MIPDPTDDDRPRWQREDALVERMADFVPVVVSRSGYRSEHAHANRDGTTG